jgi:hypothetical protein
MKLADHDHENVRYLSVPGHNALDGTYTEYKSVYYIKFLNRMVVKKARSG